MPSQAVDASDSAVPWHLHNKLHVYVVSAPVLKLFQMNSCTNSQPVLTVRSCLSAALLLLLTAHHSFCAFE